MQNRFAQGPMAKSVAPAALVALAGAASSAPPAPAQVNTGTTLNRVLETEVEGMDDRPVSRLLSAPRLDPSAQFDPNDPDSSVPVVVHLRDHLVDLESPSQDDLGDYREWILLMGAKVEEQGVVIGHIREGRTVTIMDVNGDPVDMALGGNAYESSGLYAGFNTTDPYILDPDDPEMRFHGELNTFGGLAINGGKIAFFSGLVTPEQEATQTDRGKAPDKLSTSQDLGGLPWKPLPQFRAIWTATPDPDAEGGMKLTLLAREGLSSPIDPDTDRSFQPNGVGRNFLRVHPSDYGPGGSNLFDDIVGSWFGEQRFSRVSNIAINRAGRVAFRGDIAPNTLSDPILGIWAEGPDGAGGTALWRVFVEDAAPPPGGGGGGGGGEGDEEPPPPPDEFPMPAEENRNPWIAFENDFSDAAADFYSIVSLGPPAISDAPDGMVTAYAVLRGGDASDSGSITPRANLVAAIIGRQPGATVVLDEMGDPILDEMGMPLLEGFTPKILAIEGERFSVPGQSLDFALIESPEAVGGLSGLADVPGAGNQTRQYFKNTRAIVLNTLSSLSAFHPRPAINAENAAAFLGTIGEAFNSDGVAVELASDPIAPALDALNFETQDEQDAIDALVLDEAVWSTRNGGQLELIAREGDMAPVVVNGAAVQNARFASITLDEDLLVVDDSDFQTFYRPVINSAGEIVFIAGWMRDMDGDPNTLNDLEFGRSIFLSRAPGEPLECLVSSGDLTRERFSVTGTTEKPRGVLGPNFCRVPNPLANPDTQGSRTFEQVSWTDSGVLAFTTTMV